MTTKDFEKNTKELILNRAIPPEKLYYLSRKMEGILQLNFLKLIGFTGLKNKLAF